jgi:uncharacterized membrane protein YccC
MDYEFFQMFTEKIEGTDQETRKELVERRNLLLKISEEIREQIEARLAASREKIDKILESDSLEEELAKNIPAIDQIFIDALAMELQEAEKKDDKKRAEKINQILQILQRLSTPPELEAVEKLLDTAGDPANLDKAIEELDSELLPRVIEYLTSIVANYEEQLASGSAESKQQVEQTLEDLKKVFNGVLQRSMKSKLTS